MSAIDLLAAGLVVPLVVNWITFVVCLLAARRHPGIRTLVDRRWVSLGIAVASTGFAVLMVSYFAHIPVDGLIFVLLLTGPLYVVTFINGVFLWLTLRGEW